MRLSAIVNKVKKIEKGFFALDIIIKNIAGDVVEISKKLKNKNIRIERLFPKCAPEPKRGDIITLDEKETRTALEKIIRKIEKPIAREGEIACFLADINCDGYPELFLSNDTIELVFSPARGGLITRLSHKTAEGLLGEEILCGVEKNIVCGISLTSKDSGDFSPEKLKYRILRLKENKAISRGKKLTITMRAKSGDIGVDERIIIDPQSPIVVLSFILKNIVKKQKSKKINPALKFNLLPLGENNHKISVYEPSGKETVFARLPEFPPWLWSEDWISYQGDLKSAKNGFIAFRRRDTGEGLVVSFDPKTVIRPWANSIAIMPHVRLFAKEFIVSKSRSANLEFHLAPLDNFVIGEGCLLGKLKSENGYYIIVAGHKDPKLIIDKTDVKMKKQGYGLFYEKLEYLPSGINLSGTSLALYKK